MISGWLGGRGLIKDYRITNSEARVTASFGRSVFPPWPLAGGADGSPNLVEIRRADGSVERRGRFSNKTLKKGDVVRFITGSGGGYGDPHERDPLAVLDDVLDGYLSEGAARDVFGVVIEGEPLQVNEAETARLRDLGRG